MFNVFENFVSRSALPVRYQQWDIFLENLEPALLHSKDADHLRKNWQVRQKVIEAQRKALQEWTGSIVDELADYAKKIQDLKILADICLYDGMGTPSNRGDAIKWLQKAAEQGDAIAINILGELK